MFLVDDILGAPAKGLFSIFKIIHDKVEEELYDPARIREQLMHLQLQLDMDEITEEAYDAQEAMLLERLTEAQNRMRQ